MVLLRQKRSIKRTLQVKKTNFIFPWMKPLSKDDSWWLMFKVRMTVLWLMIPSTIKYIKNKL